MVWIQTDNEHQAGFKLDWMDEPIEWSSKQTAKVSEDVAERLVEEEDSISYVESDTEDSDSE